MSGRKIKVVPVGAAEEEAAIETSTPTSKKPRSIRPWRLFKFASCCDKLVIFIGILFAIGMGCVMPGFALIFGDSVEATAPGVSAMDAMKDTLKWFGLLCGGMFVVATIWQAAFLWTSERQCARMRKAYLEAVLMKDIAWFDVNNPAELPTRMAAEVQAIQEALGPKLGQILVCIGQFICGIIVAFTRGEEGWKMTLVICGAVPVFAISGAWLGVVVSESTGTKQTAYAKAGAVAEEVLWSMRTVVAFGGEAREAKRYYNQLWPAKRQANCTGMQMGCAFGMMIGAFAFVYALAFWFAAHHMKKITGGEVIMVFFSVIIGVMALTDLGDPMVRWSTALTSGAAMFPALDEKPRIEACRGNPGDEGAGTIQTVEFSNVVFNYPSRPDVIVLKGVSLIIQRGRKHALVGESGSGKSTVVQLLERFYDPDDGEVLVNGRKLKTLPLAWWRKQMGYVGQEPVLFATTVKKNITGGDDSIPDEKVMSVVKQAQAFDFLDALPKKLDTYVGVGGGQMSGGQKQRIAIARALLRSPQILLLDEATSALDNESEKQVQATIDRLQADKASSITTISVAHRLSTVRNSDVIFFLKMGVVHESGSHQELMALKGDYFALVKSQESVTGEEPTDGHDLKVTNISAATTPAAAVAAGVAAVQGVLSPAAASGASEPAAAEQNVARKSTTEGKEDKLKSEKEIEEERLKELKEKKYSMPILRLLGLSKKEWILFPLAFIGCLAAGATMPVQGYVLANATEVFYLFTGDALKKEVSYWALWFVFCGVGSWVGEFLKWSLFTYVQESLALRLRDMSFRSLVRQDVGFFDDPKNTPAGLTTTLERQTKQVSQMTGINLGNVCATLCAILTGLALGFIGSWKLTAVCLALMPVVMVAISIVMVAQMGAQQGNSAYAHAGAILSEAILNIRTVRALQAEQQSLDSFAEVVNKVAGVEGGCQALRKAAAYGFGQSASMVIYIVGFWYGAKLIDDGEISQSEMFESIYCVMFGLFGAGMAMAFAPDAAKGKIAAYDIFRLVDRESKVDAVKPVGTHTGLGDGSITFDNVVFHYPHRPELPVLKGLSFNAQAGQTVALVGPSGSGKSTVIQMLQRFYDPTTGQVLIGGVDLKKFNIAWWRQQVALVGQEPVLFDMSLEDNVKYGKPDATRNEVEAAARKANMDYVLNGKARWEDPVGLRGGRLSGGQKQRCAIARAIIREPSVLLLDEATSALDSVSEKEVQKALDAARQGRTTFTIAHRLSTIQDSDRIVVIVEGLLSEQGTHEELMKKGGVYANLAMRGSS